MEKSAVLSTRLHTRAAPTAFTRFERARAAGEPRAVKSRAGQFRAWSA